MCLICRVAKKNVKIRLQVNQKATVVNKNLPPLPRPTSRCSASKLSFPMQVKHQRTAANKKVHTHLILVALALSTFPTIGSLHPPSVARGVTCFPDHAIIRHIFPQGRVVFPSQQRSTVHFPRDKEGGLHCLLDCKLVERQRTNSFRL